MSLSIRAIEGKNLPLLEKSGSQSTFVMAEFQGYSLTSKVFGNSLNPDWNELFEFPIGKMGITEDDLILFSVFTYRTEARGKLIGKCTTDAVQLKINSTIIREIKLKDNNGLELKATVVLELIYVAPPPVEIYRKVRTAEIIAQETLSIVKDTYQIQFTVHECRKLTHLPCDPVVVLTIGRDTRSTQIAKDTTDPIFEESIPFVTYNSPFEIAKEVVHVQVLNTLRYDEASLIGEFKFVLMTAFYSDPIGWDEPAYRANDTCRTMFKKWVMLTHPTEWPKNIKGFTLLSMSLLASGQALIAPPRIESLLLDVMSNIMRPSEIFAQYQKLVIRIHLAEDLPPMSIPYIMPDSNLIKTCFVDPYVQLSYSGDISRTQLYYSEDNPVFMKDIYYNLEVPTISDTIIFKLMDRDIEFDGIDDPIGTLFLKLDDISYRSSDDIGFNPMFGPTYLNFYGRPRELKDDYEKFNYLNEGWVPGVAFRGRLLVEIFTKPSYSVGLFSDVYDSPADAKTLVEPFVNRKKFILLVGFIEAAMIEFGDATVQFEVSVGDYGNSMSDRSAATNSLTFFTQPLFDGTKYYYCNWDEGRPACLLPMMWEDVSFRLHTVNILEKIALRLDDNLKLTNDFIQVEANEKDIKAQMKRTLKDLASDCQKELPELPAICTNLDKSLRKLRHFKLKKIAKAALSEIPNIKATWDFYYTMCVYRDKIKDACMEPQTQIPDLLIWMLINGTRVAYYKAPIHWFLYNKKNPGRCCDKIRNVSLSYLGSKDADRSACLLKCFSWLGTEEEYWNYDLPSDGRITVYAETYENQTVLGTQWGVKGLTRPEFSTADGKYPLPLSAFLPPVGWEWGEEWQITLDFSSIVSSDYGLLEYTDKVYEVEEREEGKTWSSAKQIWTTLEMEESRGKQDLPNGWVILVDWKVNEEQPGDEDGWQYAVAIDSSDYNPSVKSGHFFRRRMWVRHRKKVGETVLPTYKEVIEETGGWSYAKTFENKFHSGELNSDIVRRRRWRRMMNSRSVGPCVFEVIGNDQIVHIPPVMMIEFPEVNKYEIRAYIYQGRELYSPEVSGMINSYCVVSCWRYTQITRLINQQLSPTWDQAFVFKGIKINGNTNDVKNSLPAVDITIWHKGANQDTPVGVCSVDPTPLFGESYKPSRMKWYPVYTNGKHHGDILAAFEIFLEMVGEDIPFMPPPHPTGFGLQVPPGIRPILKQSRIEVLSWGLRHLQFWSGKPVDNPNVEIECGGAILTLPKIEDVINNPNFPKTAHFFDVSLPQENNFKPPINIRLLDQRPNGFTPLVGKYVIKDFKPFDPEFILKQLLAAKENRNLEEDKNSDKNSLISDTIAESEESNPETLIIIEDEIEPTGCAACLSKKNRLGRDANGLVPITIVDESDDWEFLSMYWWSRYEAMQGNRLLYKTFQHHELPIIVVYESEIEEYFNNFSDSIQQFKLQRCPKLGGDPNVEDPEKDPDIGMYKGSFRIYNITQDESKNKELIYGTTPTVGPIQIIVRCYALQGLKLACPSRIKEKTCDPFLRLQLGSREIRDESSIVKTNRNPRFCKVYNMNTIIPNMPQLIVQVWDWKATIEGRELLIGETRIDLENRYLSVKRPMCGLTERYMIDGPHRWRDFMTPVQILEEWCLANGIAVPEYSSDGRRAGVNDDMFSIEEFEKHGVNFDDKTVWGEPKERTALYILLEFGLIRDYVEKRLLTNPVMPGVPQGRILMWVDIFPFSEKPPEPMKVDEPVPVNQELRVIVYEVTDVETVTEIEPGPGIDKLNDLYCQGHFSGDSEVQVSELHRRAVKGDAMFNWRFIFNFSYAYLTRKVVIPGTIEDTYLDPIVTFQVRDSDPSVQPDAYGYVHLNLAYLPRGQPYKKWALMDMIPEYIEPPKGKDEVYDPDDQPLDRPPKITYLNLYKKKKTQGWWPLYRKQGDYLVKNGNIRMELEVMTKEQADKRPAGIGREEPNANPLIPPPIRTTTQFGGLQAKINTIIYILKSPNRWKFIGGLIGSLLGMVFGSLMFNAPSSILASITG